jgi:BirA family biotin operon repressor/biotin-[acetyl-CoA-carboxylase] ligase
VAFDTPQPLPLDVAEAVACAGTRLDKFVTRWLWYSQITSTNDVAALLADAGAEEGVVVAADAQTAGRGRLGRSWASPAGAGIYATVILRPKAETLPLLTLAAGVAIAEGIEAATGLTPSVKWPNDIVVANSPASTGGGKLAGILAEAGTSTSGSPWVAMGFGINVMPASYPPDVAPRAASLERELGRSVDRGLVLAECLAALSVRYRALRDGEGASIVSAWRARAASMFGRHVEWQVDGRTLRGIAQDIDEGGALLVNVGNGLVRVMSGEVRWV